jgi:hypothetical protein
LDARAGKKGGPARAAGLTAEQRSESARNAVSARWAKTKNGNSHASVPSAPAIDTSRKTLHVRLNRLKSAKSKAGIRRLTEELQRIVFHKQYRNAEN